MRTMKIINWLKSGKSDFFLYAAIIVLINLVGIQAYLRLDLTSRKTYSLSEVSKQAIRSLEEPLSVKVFFSPKLPAPYNNVDLYLRDLMGEYGRAGSPNFSYEFYNMEKEENKTVAQDFGIYPIQVQHVKDDEIQVVSAFLGLAVSYGDNIEQMNNINYTDGLEYDLTTLIQKMVTKSDSLSGLSGKVRMTLYRSKVLEDILNVDLDDIEQVIYDAYSTANRENFEKIEYDLVDPVTVSEINQIVDHYGIQKITWGRRDGSGEKGTAIFGLVLEYNDDFTVIPVKVGQDFLRGNVIFGIDNLSESISSSLEVLTSSASTVAYLTGHGEKGLDDSQQGSALFKAVTSDIYEFSETDLSEEGVPDSVQTLVINGPTQKMNEDVLYKIDQFLMRGGSLVVFLDPFQEIFPQQNQGYGGGRAVYPPVSTGLEQLLEAYGVKVKKDYVLDSNCYIHRQQGQGEIPLYYVPIVTKDHIDQYNSISKHLTNIAFLKAASLETVLPEDGAVKGTVIVSSSDESWLMTGQIQLDPYSMRPPPEEQMSSYPLAALLEGRFSSYFEKSVSNDDTDDGMTIQSFLPKSTADGKIFIIASSAMTTSQLLDEQGRSSNSIFIHNILDYMNGNEELNEMRSKGLSFNPLDEVDDAVKNFIKYFNMIGIPVLVIIVGLIVWQIGNRRRERIRLAFLGNHTRVFGSADSDQGDKMKGDNNE